MGSHTPNFIHTLPESPPQKRQFPTVSLETCMSVQGLSSPYYYFYYYYMWSERVRRGVGGVGSGTAVAQWFEGSSSVAWVLDSLSLKHSRIGQQRPSTEGQKPTAISLLFFQLISVPAFDSSKTKEILMSCQQIIHLLKRSKTSMHWCTLFVFHL